MSAPAAQPTEIDVQNIIGAYKTMRAQITEMASKISELDSDKAEHALVLRAISPLDRDRKCYRSIGGVLVERTVGEVQPAVEKNLKGIEDLITKLTTDLREKEKEADDFRIKYNITMGDQKVRSITNQLSVNRAINCPLNQWMSISLSFTSFNPYVNLFISFYHLIILSVVAVCLPHSRIQF